MNADKLFQAIGELDDGVLMGADETPRRNRRIGWKVALVAAVVAGLAVSAAAAPAIRNAIFGAKVEKDKHVWISATDPADGSSYEMNVYDIRLELEVDENAPDSIEVFYVPEVPEELVQIKGHIHPLEGENALTQFWWINEETDSDIFFSQQAGGSLTPEDLTEHVSTALGGAPSTKLCTIAEIDGYLIDVRPVGDGIGGDRIFYWSDGQYLFRLEVPYEYSDAQLEELVASVQPVEDIVPYLSTMTQQELEDAIG